MAFFRYLNPFIQQDLKRKMVFLAGPRQVGKTTLAKKLFKQAFVDGEYFNWDIDDDRKAIIEKHWQKTSSLIVLDELHKFPRWKQWIKGVYDAKPNHQQYVVTGSARLDTYCRGGDSLLGRYHYWRLHPLTLDEYPTSISANDAYNRLIQLGGFPEPFLLNDEREARRWRRERFDRLLREDIRDLQLIKQIQLLYLFVDALRDRVGGQLVLANLANDLQVSPKTAKMWLELVERIYLAFAIYPLTRHIPRAIQKPPKVYFYDNADVRDGESLRLENLVATHLLKRLHFIEDYHGYRASLHYIRDKDGREVDFVTVINDEIIDLIEVKLNDSDISSALRYYDKKLKPKRCVQIVGHLKRPFDSCGIHVTHPAAFFVNPPWSSENL